MLGYSPEASALCDGCRANDVCRARLLHPKPSIAVRLSVSPVSAPRDCVPPSPGAFDPAGRSRARQSAPCSTSFVALSSILLIALVRRILFDVAVTALLIEVLAFGNLLLELEIRVGPRALVAALFRRDGRHFRHGSSPLMQPTDQSNGPGPSRHGRVRII